MSNIAIPETLLGLVSHYSPTGSESPAAGWLVERMHLLGYEQTFLDAAGNPVGVIGKGPRQIVLMGHIDTVPGELPVHISDGILYGRGAVDAKGPLAAFVDAAAQSGAGEGWQVVVIGALEEEGSSRGARFAADHYHPEYAVIGEPNRWDRAALGYKGTAWAEISIKIEQFHSAGGGKTAAEVGFEIWHGIQTFATAYNTGRDRVFDQIQPSLQKIESGVTDFEQWARLSVSARLPVDMPPEAWYTQLEKIAVMGKVEPKGKPIAAWVCDKNTRLVRAMLAAIRGEGGTPAFVNKTGTADLNIVAPVWKCPTLVYGPGDSSLDHTPNEKLDLKEYQLAVRVLASALGKLMEKPEN